MKEGVLLAPDLSLENSVDSYACFQLALLHSVSYFHFFAGSPFDLHHYLRFLVLFHYSR